MYDNLTSAALEEKATQLVAEIDGLFDKCKAERRDLTRSEAKQVDRKQDELDRVASLIESRRERKGAPAIAFAPSASEPRSSFPAAARGSLQSEMTYRPDKTAEMSFVRDLINAGHSTRGSRAARYRTGARRSTRTAGTRGIGRVPRHAELDDAGQRVRAAAVSRGRVGPAGDRPPSVRGRASAASVASHGHEHLDPEAFERGRGGGAFGRGSGQLVGRSLRDRLDSVNEISGLVDIGRQALMRSDPGLDQVILQTLRRRYDAYLDTQLLSGSGTAPQHRGLTMSRVHRPRRTRPRRRLRQRSSRGCTRQSRRSRQRARATRKWI